MWRVLSGISGSSVCVYVLMGVSVITWPTGHETEKQTQALWVDSQGDRTEVVCFYYIGAVKRQYVSCDVCECF